jgi:hypothetical protein
LLDVIFTGLRKTGHFDLEATETATRAAAHHLGAGVLEALLAAPSDFAAEVPCSCGHSARFREMRSKQLTTVVGPIKIQRPYYLCAHCHQGQSPRDAELDVQGTEYSPGVRRMMAVVGSDTSFEHGREQLETLAGLQLTAKAVERHAEAIGADVAARDEQLIRSAKQLDLPIPFGQPIPILYLEMDGTGLPVVSSETAGRTGKVDGQPARTRECKLGAVFTQTTVDARGRPMRDEDSTSYVGAIETAEEFGLRIYTEAWQRGWSRAQIKVVIGDGADWIWNIAEQHFPGAIQIVDLFHARQHLWGLAAVLCPNNPLRQQRWVSHKLHWLDNGQIGKLVNAIRAAADRYPDAADEIRLEANYFEKNAHRMRYPEFRRQQLFVGSGVIEAACKTVIAARLKRSGMFWTVRGANAIIALRCNRLSGKFEDYWSTRQEAA